jgi:hypothetical protein
LLNIISISRNCDVVPFGLKIQGGGRKTKDPTKEKFTQQPQKLQKFIQAENYQKVQNFAFGTQKSLRSLDLQP